MGKVTTKRILKVAALFSGTESVNILCSIVKMKLVALWLSATGVGLFGLLNTTIESVSIITGLGLRQSAVRDVAAAKERTALQRVVDRVRSWSAIAGLLGAVVMSALSPLLSNLMFGTLDMWWAFMILAGCLLLNALIGGEQAILQGTGGFSRLARASVGGALSGLIISIPLFRFMGDASVPYSLLAYSVCTVFFLFVNRDKSLRIRRASRAEIKRGAGFVKLGGYMATALFMTNLAQLIFITWLNRETSTEMVGYYQSGNTLINRYMGIILNAVALEFYPRMAANSHSPRRMALFVNHEISLMMKIFVPLVVLFILCREWVVRLLYTDDFLVVIPFVTVGCLSIVVKAVSTCIAFSIVAKGDGRTYIVTEGVDAIIGLALNIVLYKFFGLYGIGYAMLLWTLNYLMIIWFVYRFKYRLRVALKPAALAAGGFALCAAVAALILW